jgi:beta-glucosidase
MNTRFLLGASVLFLAVGQGVHAQSRDPDARAAATEARMTDAERYQLLHSVMPFPIPGTPPPTEPVKAMAGYIRGIERLGIPAMTKTDASLGVTNPLQLRKDDVATAMPSGLALAATFDPTLAYAGGKMIGAEARAKGFNVLLGGGANLARDPRNGRNFEYLGEDPLLAGILTGEAVRGTQSEGVVSTIKHFALNDQETHRNTLNAVIGEAALRESDLLAFEIAIERGQPGSVMCAYNRVNGPWACGSDFLLNKVLKGDWNYKGWVMSDWGAVHAVDYAGLGLDQQAGATLDAQIWFDKPLKTLVASGTMPKARIADMNRRILRSLYAVGADAPLSEGPIDYDAHGKVAYQAAADGIVLLKNEGNILPLATSAKKILIVGGHADIGVMSGGGSSQVTPVGGSAFVPVGGPGFLAMFGKQLIVPSSPLRALQATFPAAQYDSGYFPESTAAAAKSADLVIVFATQWNVESMDSGSMMLPQGQDALIAAVAKANPNIVVVLETGNAVRMPWLKDVKAVIEAWYPGQRGGEAIADVLTGKINPSGRLPVTFPIDETQLPRPAIPGLGASPESDVTVDYRIEGADVGYRWFARESKTPLFAFGHGLNYTRFEHGALQVREGKTLQASFTVRNTGNRAGADVPQLYLTDMAGKSTTRLVAFSKVMLAPGESKAITLDIDPRLLANWSDGRWQIKAGVYRFSLAKSAAAAGVQAEATLRGRSWGYGKQAR